MNKKLAEIYQDGVRFALWRIEGEGYVIYENDNGRTLYLQVACGDYDLQAQGE